LKKRFAGDLLRISVEATPQQLAALPGVASALAANGAYVVALAPGTDRRAFLKDMIDRYDVTAFSEKDPELEEIYLSAVRAAGLDDAGATS
jgi:ABC-type uncharacterized transport system ATPase subunit